MVIMANGSGLKVDDGSRLALQSQFDATYQGQTNAVKDLGEVQTLVGTSWKSDSAAPKYLDAMTLAHNALEKIRSALDLIGENMKGYGMDTTGAEHDNTATAQHVVAAFDAGWAV